jgi:16S rRNA (guanine527-N7)-methyltransferase
VTSAATRKTLPERLAEDRRTALRLVAVSRETEDRLGAYVDLLARWRRAGNLLAESTFGSVWTRHIADSAQLLALAPGAIRWVDMGSGAGFPGLVIAIQLAEARGAIVHCIESDTRKCAFLREAARATGAPAEIHPQRVEVINPWSVGVVDAVSARAFAHLPRTLELAKVWLEQGAVGLFPRGRSAREQIAAMSPSAYGIETLSSAIDPESGILRVRAG